MRKKKTQTTVTCQKVSMTAKLSYSSYSIIFQMKTKRASTIKKKSPKVPTKSRIASLFCFVLLVDLFRNWITISDWATRLI